MELSAADQASVAPVPALATSAAIEKTNDRMLAGASEPESDNERSAIRDSFDRVASRDPGTGSAARMVGADSGGGQADGGVVGADWQGDGSAPIQQSGSTANRENGSTAKSRPLVLSLVKSGSTATLPEVVSQHDLIGSPAREWTKIKGKPPYPKYHKLEPSGKRDIGRRRFVGYEILRRVKCQEPGCSNYRRLTAGYVSATQMMELEYDSKDTQIGVIRNILRKKAAEIDERSVNLRCAGCLSRREALGSRIVGLD